MDLITKERDHLLQRTARVWGLCFSIVSLLCLLLPGAMSLDALPIAAACYVALFVAQVRLGDSRAIGWVLLALVAGLAAIATVLLLGSPGLAGLIAVTQLSAASLPAVALMLTTSPARLAVLVLGALGVSALTVALTTELQPVARTLSGQVIGWVLPTVIAVWISAGVPQVARRIASIGRAHRAERQASEVEAQRRQSARLLHDTVLATLTLLAHSGVGVSASALQQQAADDAKLLRQLRLGGTPTPATFGGEEAPQPVEESVLGTTLESVKSRFGRMGLEVAWHGTGQVLLPSHVLDAFLLALAECLENVRRHSGVTTADVTITEDDTTVRALVTDAGVGFDIANVDDAKLGFAESVVARLRDVGGNARLFSAPGSGTTVVLEVPR
jgi:signal transduction histidine kinase